jgi:hypothetical protein
MANVCQPCTDSDTTQSTLRNSSLNSSRNSSLAYQAAELHDEFLSIAAKHGNKCKCLKRLIKDDDLSKAAALLHSVQVYLLHHTDDTPGNTKLDLVHKILNGMETPRFLVLDFSRYFHRLHDSGEATTSERISCISRAGAEHARATWQRCC